MDYADLFLSKSLLCLSASPLLPETSLWTLERMKAVGRGKPSWALATVFVSITLVVLTSRCVSSNQKMTQTAMGHSTDAAAGPGHSLLEDLLGFQLLAELFASEQAEVWLYSLAGSVVVGLSGIFPLLVIPIEAGAALKTEGGKFDLNNC